MGNRKKPPHGFFRARSLDHGATPQLIRGAECRACGSQGHSQKSTPTPVRSPSVPPANARQAACRRSIPSAIHPSGWRRSPPGCRPPAWPGRRDRWRCSPWRGPCRPANRRPTPTPRHLRAARAPGGGGTGRRRRAERRSREARPKRARAAAPAREARLARAPAAQRATMPARRPGLLARDPRAHLG